MRKMHETQIGETHTSIEASPEASTEDHHEPGLYEVRIKGHLDDRWADWFGGLTITLDENGDTLLAGPVVDQAALFGLLRKVRDLGMPLISVIRVVPGQAGRRSHPVGRSRDLLFAARDQGRLGEYPGDQYRGSVSGA